MTNHETPLTDGESSETIEPVEDWGVKECGQFDPDAPQQPGETSSHEAIRTLAKAFVSAKVDDEAKRRFITAITDVPENTFEDS